MVCSMALRKRETEDRFTASRSELLRAELSRRCEALCKALSGRDKPLTALLNLNPFRALKGGLL